MFALIALGMAFVIMTGGIDLYSPASYANGHPVGQYAWLRDNDPVHWHSEPDGPGFWAVTRHEDVKALSRDTALFSSRPAIMIDDGSSPAGTSIARHRKAFSNTLSSGLLIRGFGVRVPGGAPVLTWGFVVPGLPF